MRVEERPFFSAGKRIAARVRIPRQQQSPAIVINHGYSGDKQEYDAMAHYLCERGFLTIQFDSRGCGESEAPKGRMMCGTEWLEDAANAVSYAAGLEEADADKIGFTGCSMGGALTVCMAALDSRVKCAVAMAPLASGREMLGENWTRNRSREAYEAFLRELEADSRETVKAGISKYVSVPYALGMGEADERDYHRFRDEHPGMVRDVPLESVANSFLRFEPWLYASAVEVPLLLMHGSADTIVSLRHSQRIRACVHTRCELKVIDGAPHPLPTSDYAPQVFELAADWFEQYL